jgi:anti-sigma B factor antagonist
MTVTVEHAKGGVCRLAVQGDMTIYTALELKDELLQPLGQADKVELDLAAVSEIDSAGLQLMVLLKTEAKEQGKTLNITGHSPAVLDILELCDLEGFFGDNVLIHLEQ